MSTATEPVLLHARSRLFLAGPTAFDRFADWVSEAMGRPPNIAFRFVLIAAWTLLFALGDPRLASGNWLSAWCTSQGHN
jgi:hypothetical protein